ncbi:MAG TPA: winged helix-turn-helix domain-containing protein [Terracidiphilus sp.]|nr:winged helix-turn-helix domain-containing protein [Terracidiphilus sp.]
MSDPRPAPRYRFGAFEADANTGELRRQGIRIRLNTQPFQVLTMLLDRPGELLTRDEIARELWPQGTFVDYEHGLNSAINRIREALGDTASSPRFVETLARRGYRFVAPVERITAEIDSPAPPDQTTPPAPAEQVTPPPEPSPQPETETEADLGLGAGILASPKELPKAPFHLVQTLFVLFQLMYLGFYIGALANLGEIEDLLSVFRWAAVAVGVIVVSSAILIAVRGYVICLALFHAPGARRKFLKIWPGLLVLDELWALSPFLLMHHINFGLALACMALLAYAPFVQRSLVLMGAAGSNGAVPTAAR